MGRIIAISGPIGGGKSTLAAGLQRALPDACLLSADDYEDATRLQPERLRAWIEAGADFDAFDFPQLADHLERLKRGESILLPDAGRRVQACGTVLFETNFGRAHRASGRLIDLLIWVETPLDLALARKARNHLRVILQNSGASVDPRSLNWLDAWFGHYLDWVGQLLRLQAERVRPEADVILDGSQAPEQVLQTALSTLEAKLA